MSQLELEYHDARTGWITFILAVSVPASPAHMKQTPLCVKDPRRMSGEFL